jgi:membrane protease YdiL (CAAX protease family)
MLFIFRKDGHRFSILDRGIPASRYVLAALIPAGGGLLVYLLNNLLFREPAFGDLTGLPWGLLLWVPLGAIGEELGWRGYLHKRLDLRLTGLISSIVVGLLWALWHVGTYQNGALYIAFFLLLMTSYTIVIYALVVDTGFNVTLAAIFHMMINVTNLFSFSVINNTSFMMLNAAVWAVIAIGLVLARHALFTTRKPGQ